MKMNCFFCGTTDMLNAYIPSDFLNVWRCNKSDCSAVIASYDDGIKGSMVGFNLPIRDKSKKLLIHDGIEICARIGYEYHAYIFSAGMGFLAQTDGNTWRDLDLWKEMFDFGFNNQLALYHIEKSHPSYGKLYAMGLTVDN